MQEGKPVSSKDSLKDEINTIRRQLDLLIEKSKEDTLTDERFLDISRRLDILIVNYMRAMACK